MSEPRVLEIHTAPELAYLAGLIDGEGHIDISCNGSRRLWRCQLTITNTDQSMIDWLEQRFGGRVFLVKKAHPKSGKQIRFWILSRRRELEPLLEQTLPYLVTKSARAQAALRFLRECMPGSGRLRTNLQIQLAGELREAIRA